MAKIKGPLFSQEAHGNVGGDLQFRLNRHGAHVYRPPDPRTQNQATATPAQAVVRDRYAQIRSDWQSLDANDRATWIAKARTELRPVSGWNLYLAERMKEGDIGIVRQLFAGGEIGGYWPMDIANITQDSGNATPGTVDAVVGHVLDVATPYSETEVPLTLLALGAWSNMGGGAYSTNSSASYLTFNAPSGLSSGVLYKLTFTVDSISGGSMGLIATYYGTSQFISTPGAKTLTFTNLAQTRLYFYGSSACVGVVRDIRLFRISGNAAAQATTANKPYLRRTPTTGKYWLDGNTATAALVATTPTPASPLYTAEMGRVNYLSYSEDLTNSLWQKGNVTATANSIKANATTSNHILYKSSIATPAGSLYVKIRARYINHQWLVVRFGDGTAVKYASVDLLNKVLGSKTTNITVTVTPIDATDCLIEANFSGAVASTNSSVYFSLNAADALALSSWTATGNEEVGIVYAQLSTVAADYQKTTYNYVPCEVARLDPITQSVVWTDEEFNTTAIGIVAPFGFNSDTFVRGIAVSGRLSAAQKAAVERLMKRNMPRLGGNLATPTLETTGWSPYGANTLTKEPDGSIKVTFVDATNGVKLSFRYTGTAGYALTANPVVGRGYMLSFAQRVTEGSIIDTLYNTAASWTVANSISGWTTYTLALAAQSSTTMQIIFGGQSAVETQYFKSVQFMEIV